MAYKLQYVAHWATYRFSLEFESAASLLTLQKIGHLSRSTSVGGGLVRVALSMSVQSAWLKGGRRRGARAVSMLQMQNLTCSALRRSHRHPTSHTWACLSLLPRFLVWHLASPHPSLPPPHSSSPTHHSSFRSVNVVVYVKLIPYCQNRPVCLSFGVFVLDLSHSSFRDKRSTNSAWSLQNRSKYVRTLCFIARLGMGISWFSTGGVRENVDVDFTLVYDVPYWSHLPIKINELKLFNIVRKKTDLD